MDDTSADAHTPGASDAPNPQRRGPGGLGPGPWLVMAAVVVVTIAGSLLIELSPLVTIGLLVVVLGGTLALNAWRMRKRSQRATSVLVFLGQLAAVGVLTLVVLNLVPGTRGIDNPPVTAEPEWAGDAQSAEGQAVRALAVRACYDCHSNETVEPWYANVAPLSMALQEHVEEGRAALNFSEFDRPQEEADDAGEVTEEGEMPPAYYTRFGLHSEANLTDAEVRQLVDGLAKTPGFGEGGGEREGEYED